MDRNDDTSKKTQPGVALRKESVDRNITGRQFPAPKPPSLSARRAWIEIGNSCTQSEPEKVALRKESVDRNALVREVK